MKTPNFALLLSALFLSAGPVPALAQQVNTLSAPVAAPTTQPVTLPYSVKAAEGTQLLLSQALPQGMQYVQGSSRLNGQATADPVYGPSGTLYWTVPAREDGQLRFEVTGPASQVANLALPALHRIDPQNVGGGSGPRYLPISGSLNMTDFVQAKAFVAAQPVRENAGQIKLPADGTVFRSRDKITVVVEGPLGAAPVPYINGKPATPDQVGTTITDPQRGIQRLEYYGVPIRTGVNHITLGQDDIVVKLAGEAAQVVFEPLNTVADGVTPVRIKVRTLDAAGLATSDTSLSLRSNLEPVQGTFDVVGGGYQIPLQNGEGLLQFIPQTTPTTLQMDVLAGKTVIHRELDVRPDAHAVGVGLVSATLGFSGTGNLSDNFSVRARAYYEGPVAGGKLYFAADKDGLPTTTGALPTNERFVNYGDSSVETIPLQGTDPVAFIYDHPRFKVAYRLTNLPLSILPMNSQITALTVQSRSNPAVSGFVAWVPGGQITDERIIPEGTRLLRLGHSNIDLGSQVLTLVKQDRVSGAEISRTPLLEGADYSIDPATGIVTLNRSLSSVDGELNTQYVSASYRLLNSHDDRQLAYGVQLAQRGDLGAGRYEVGAALARLENINTYGVGAKYSDPQVEAAANVSYSGGVMASARIASKHERHNGSFSVRYQNDSYEGLGKGSKGFSASGRYDWQLTQVWGTRLEGEYGNQTLSGSNGYMGVLGTYKLAPWTLGAGVRYGFGTHSGFGFTGLVGYNQSPFGVEVSHTQPVSGTLDPTTDLKFSYRINQWTALEMRDVYNWNTGNTGAVSVNTTLGKTNYIVAYETGNSSGQENRARFGVGTSLPLNDRTNLGLRGAYLRNLQSQTNEVTAGADLTYKGDNYTAGLGGDYSYRSDTGGATVLHGGITGDLTSRLNLASDFTSEMGARQGLKFGVGYAYRAPLLSSLGYMRYLQGSLAGGKDAVSAGLAAEYRVPTFAVRGGIDARMLLADHDTLTYQPYLGGNVYFADRFSVGAWARALLQPATSINLYGYGLEAGVKAIPGLWLTAGYNLNGFDGIPTAGFYTKQGMYLRLDLTLDETLNGAKK